MMHQPPLSLRPRKLSRELSMHPAAIARRDRQRAAEEGHAKAQQRLAEWRRGHRAELQADLDRAETLLGHCT